MTVQDGSEKEDLAADLSDYSRKEEPGGSVGVGTPAGQNARRLVFFGLAALIVAAAVAVVRLSGTPSFENASIASDGQKASYGIGLRMGSQLADAADALDRAAFMRGFEDAMDGEDSDVESNELNAVTQIFIADMQASAEEEDLRIGEENAVAGTAYRADNAARDGVLTTDSGMQYEVLRAGEGPNPTLDQSVRLHYRGMLVDGTEFDSSYEGDPAVFGVGQLIAGFTEALTLMQAGSHFRIVLPPNIGYGPSGSGGGIGPNATLIFEIELLEIVE
jgi:FKBP-type peptidyl-prolyl cis-trans isomerase FkpA/FKBP-type peptidyl-prolyl cis-trans isomerase FklB